MPHHPPRRPAAVVAVLPPVLRDSPAPASPPLASSPTAPTPASPSRVIHFGQFIRHHRLRAGKTTEAFGREIGLTGRRVIGLEAMATADVQQTTLTALARALHLEPEEFDAAWRSTPVPITPRRAGPTTEPAQRFAAACRTAGISTAEGMRRLRRWLIAQDPATQQRVLAAAPAPAAPADSARAAEPPLYTDLVDHLQDPAEATRQRIAANAATAANAANAMDATHPATAGAARPARSPAAPAARSGRRTTGRTKK